MRAWSVAVAALLLCPAPGRAAGARSALELFLRGPAVACRGEQAVDVRLNGADLQARVEVAYDGRGGVRRQYLTGAASGACTLQLRGRTWSREADGRWSAAPAPSWPVAQLAAAILSNYRVSVSDARLLGRPAWRLTLRPAYSGGPSRILVVDRATGIALMDELLGPDGALRSRSTLRTLEVGGAKGAAFAVPAAADTAGAFGPASFVARSNAAAVERETGRPVLLPAYVPHGFHPALFGVMTTGSGRLMPVVQYFDGLATFTVFQRGRGAGRRGCLVAGDNQRAVVTAQTARSNYLVMGDLAGGELRKVAASLP